MFRTMTTLLTRTGRLTPADAKSVKSFSFDVPEGTEAMSLVFEWDPDHCDDAERNERAVIEALTSWGRLEMRDHPDVKRNIARQLTLLNTVLVEPSGRWRGRSDRGKGTKDDPLVVDPISPASGFVGGAIEPGRWSIDLEVHSVVTDECNFTLEIRAIPRLPPDTTSTAAGAHGASRASRAAAAVVDQGARWVRGELHSHSRHSDGSHHVDELVRRARELGLDFLCLTDHNTTSGGAELRRQPFPTILGAELTTFRGHHVVLGLDEMVPWHKHGVVRDPNLVADEIKAKGALLTLTHPFALGDPICTGCRFTSALDPAKADLVEIWHRRWSGDSADNPRALRLWNDLWKSGHRPTGIAVRDWHNKNHEALLPGPLPTTAVFARSLDQRDVLDGLRRGAAYLTRGPQLDFALVVDGRRVTLENPRGARGSHAEVEVNVDGAQRIELWKNGEQVATKDGPRAVFADDDARGFYRVDVHDDDGPLCIANHVVLD
jgi:hypothetical protein